MPIYEYRCPDCSVEFEKLVMGFDAPTPECPDCGGEHAERLISRLGLAGAPSMSGDDLFFSDKLTFTQKQGLKGRVPQVAKQAYKAMRAERQASGVELTHEHLSDEELAELDPEDPVRLQQEAGHYHPDDHIHLVDDPAEAGHDHAHGHDHPHEHDHGHSHGLDGDHGHDHGTADGASPSR